MLKGGFHIILPYYAFKMFLLKSIKTIQTINDIKVFKLIFINFNKNLLFIIILSLLVEKF